MTTNKNIEPKLTRLEDMREYLKANGWEQSWSDDNWVRSDAENKEANTGIDTKYAYAYQYKVNNNLTYVTVYKKP
jgi:hypothetical protein